MSNEKILVIRKWNKDTKFALKFSKFCVWPLGLWPLDENSAFLSFRYAYSFISQIWMIGTQSMAAYLNCGDASDNVDYVMMAVCAVMSISKILALQLHRSKVRAVVTSAVEDWLSITDDHHRSREILLPFAKKGRTVFYVQMIFCYISNSLIIIGSLPFLVPPAISNETSWGNTSEESVQELPIRQLPLQSGCLFTNVRDGIYVFLYVYESIMITVTAHGNVGSDVFIFSLVMYLCGQIELLKNDLMEIGKDGDGNVESRDRIVTCVQRHAFLLNLIMDLKQTISAMLIIQLLLNAGMNLMLGLRIIMAVKSGILVTALRPIFAFNVLMLQLYLLSYAGDRLSQQTDTVLDALYDSQWYLLPPKLRKDLYFLAMRANKPVHLTAGQFYVMNLENFKNVLKASFSYFSILQVMFDA